MFSESSLKAYHYYFCIYFCIYFFFFFFNLLADPAIDASAACFLLISFLLRSDSAMSIQRRSTAMHPRHLSAEWPCQMPLMDDKTPLLWHLEPSSPMLCWNPEQAHHGHASLLPDDPPFQQFLNTGNTVLQRAVRNIPLQKLKRQSLIYFLEQTGHFSTHCTSDNSAVLSSCLLLGWVLRLKSRFCCFTCLVMAQTPAWAWQPRRAHSKPAVLHLPFQGLGMKAAGVQDGRRHPCLGQMDPPRATQTAGQTWTERQLTSNFWALQMWQERRIAVNFC